MRVLTTCWRILDGMRRFVLNVVFFAVLAAAAAIVWRLVAPPSVPSIEPKTVLVVEISGRLSELPSGAGMPVGLTDLAAGLDDKPVSTRVSDVVEALGRAKDDPNIAAVVLSLGRMAPSGLASVRVVGEALDGFRASGRKVYAWGASFTQSQYAIAAHADELSIHPMGSAEIKGLSGSSLYWGAFLARFGVKAEVYKAGAFKSAPEIFSRSAPSEDNLLAQKSYLEPAWLRVAADIEKARGLMPGELSAYLETLPQKAADGVSAAAALKDAGLVTAVESESAFEKRIADAAAGGDVKKIKAVSLDGYLLATEPPVRHEPGVVVVTAEGTIGADARAGINADELCSRIDMAAEHALTKAIVLRLNSPGGEAEASEQIRESLEAARRKGIKVVVSMGDAAASGGYWIATASDKIVADPLSVTGSIGVYAVMPNLVGALDLLEIGTGGYATTPYADAGDGMHETTPEQAAVLNAGVMETYRTFKRYVSESRKMSVDDVERVAQGHVWLGMQAEAFGLVDKTGGLFDALRLARDLSQLPADAPVTFLDPPVSPWRSIVQSMMGEAAAAKIADAIPMLAVLEPKGSAPSAAVAQALSSRGRPLAWAPFAPLL